MSPADKALLKIYDAAFVKQADDKTGKPGSAHLAGLRAAYEKGLREGEAKAERKKNLGP